MDPYYRYYGGNNVNGYLNEESFNLGYEPISNYRLMNQPEIPVEPPREYYRHDYLSRDHEMPQMYFDNDRHGNHGFHSPRNNNNYPYAPQRIPFLVPEAGNELPSDEVSVDIRLSSSRFITRQLTERLLREDLRCVVRGQVITVTGYPRHHYNGHGFLEIVQNFSCDRGATTLHHR